MTKKNTSRTVIVLDRSGSMGAIVNDTIGGVNQFIDKQKEKNPENILSIHQFDTEFHVSHQACKVTDIASLDDSNYVPRGGTALNDAIGKTINELGNELKALPESERPDKVIFLVVTDGEENSSREFSTEQIKGMVEHQKNKYDWEFVFLGADIDSFAVGGSIGFVGASTANFNKANIVRTLSMTSEKIAAYACNAVTDMAYTDDERAVLSESKS